MEVCGIIISTMLKKIFHRNCTPLSGGNNANPETFFRKKNIVSSGFFLFIWFVIFSDYKEASPGGTTLAGEDVTRCQEGTRSATVTLRIGP